MLPFLLPPPPRREERQRPLLPSVIFASLNLRRGWISRRSGLLVLLEGSGVFRPVLGRVVTGRRPGTPTGDLAGRRLAN